MQSPKNSGFTLIELLVVVALIGLFTALSLDYLGRSRQKGSDTRRLSDLNQIQKALELFYTSNGKYPVDINGLRTAGFLSEVPSNPQGDAYKYAALGSACNSYHLGVKLQEVGSKYLSTDADLSYVGTDPACVGTNPDTDFEGNSSDCGITAGTDQCYDVTLK